MERGIYMKKGFSALGILCIIAIIGLATFAVLVNEGIIKMENESEIEKPQIEIYTKPNNVVTPNNETDIYTKPSEEKEEDNNMSERKDLSFVYSLEDEIDG